MRREALWESGQRADECLDDEPRGIFDDSRGSLSFVVVVVLVLAIDCGCCFGEYNEVLF